MLPRAPESSYYNTPGRVPTESLTENSGEQQDGSSSWQRASGDLAPDQLVGPSARTATSTSNRQASGRMITGPIAVPNRGTGSQSQGSAPHVQTAPLTSRMPAVASETGSLGMSDTSVHARVKAGSGGREPWAANRIDQLRGDPNVPHPYDSATTGASQIQPSIAEVQMQRGISTPAVVPNVHRANTTQRLDSHSRIEPGSDPTPRPSQPSYQDPAQVTINSDLQASPLLVLPNHQARPNRGDAEAGVMQPPPPTDAMSLPSSANGAQPTSKEIPDGYFLGSPNPNGNWGGRNNNGPAYPPPPATYSAYGGPPPPSHAAQSAGGYEKAALQASRPPYQDYAPPSGLYSPGNGHCGANQGGGTQCAHPHDSTTQADLYEGDYMGKEGTPLGGPVTTQSYPGNGAGYSRESPTLTAAEMPPHARIHEIWQGNEVFYCGGRIMMGPSRKNVLMSLLLIVAPGVVFAAVVAPKLNAGFNYSWIVITAVWLGILAASLIRTATMDPGVLPRNPNPPSSYLTGTLNRMANAEYRGHQVPVRYNETTHFYQPPRAHHCSINDNCYDKFDHHCPWIGTTIARRNYRTFLIFIFGCTILTMWTIVGCVLCILQGARDSVKGKTTSYLKDQAVRNSLGNNWLAFVIGTYCAIAFCFVGTLSAFHCYLVSKNMTTYESFRIRRTGAENPFDRGCIWNWFVVCCLPTPRPHMDSRWTVTDLHNYVWWQPGDPWDDRGPLDPQDRIRGERGPSGTHGPGRKQGPPGVMEVQMTA